MNVLIPFYDYDGERGAYGDYTKYAEFAPAIGDNYPADCGSLGQIPFDYTLHRDTQGRPYIALIMPCFSSAEGRNIAFMLRFKNAVAPQGLRLTLIPYLYENDLATRVPGLIGGKADESRGIYPINKGRLDNVFDITAGHNS